MDIRPHPARATVAALLIARSLASATWALLPAEQQAIPPSPVRAPAGEREPIAPFASFATGGNELSTLDMASGIQSIANEGVHHEPYYVEYIDSADGRRIYSQQQIAEAHKQAKLNAEAVKRVA